MTEFFEDTIGKSNTAVINTKWSEKHRPITCDEYVFRDDHTKRVVMNTIKQFKNGDGINTQGYILSGTPGVGKSSLGYLMANELGVFSSDTKTVSCGETSSVDMITESCLGFLKGNPLGKLRMIIFEEFDLMSAQARSAMKNVIENQSATVFYVFTTNNIEKIDKAILSRLQPIKMNKLSKAQCLERIKVILSKENVQYTPEAINYYIKEYGNDLRATINNIQFNVFDGVLYAPNGGNTNTLEDIAFDPEVCDSNLLREMHNLSSEQIDIIKDEKREAALKNLNKLNKLRKSGQNPVLIQVVEDDQARLLKHLKTITWYQENIQNI